MSIEISIVVPCYQVEKYLDRCYRSIEKQSFKDYELILVDDGSTDLTPKMCDDYAYLDSRVKVIHKKNGGLSEARNFGIQAAKGKYICFVDSDDYLHRDYLYLLYEYINKHNADVAVCNYVITDKSNQNTNTTITNINTKIFDKQNAMQELITSSTLMNYAWNKIYKRELFEEIKYPVGKRWEDIGTTYKLFDISNKIVYIDAQLYFYVQRPGSITSSNNLINILDQFDLIKARLDYLSVEYPELDNVQETQLIKVCYDCWSFLLTNKETEISEIIRANVCLEFLKENGKKTLKKWTGFERDRYKIILYFYFKPFLKLLIRLKRR